MKNCFQKLTNFIEQSRYLVSALMIVNYFKVLLFKKNYKYSLKKVVKKISAQVLKRCLVKTLISNIVKLLKMHQLNLIPILIIPNNDKIYSFII